MLLQDLLNYEFSRLESELTSDLGYLVHLFENSHLPSSFAALEEMGIAIETLEKIVTERLSSVSIEVLHKYIRTYYEKCERLSSVDKMFIALALK